MENNLGRADSSDTYWQACHVCEHLLWWKWKMGMMLKGCESTHVYKDEAIAADAIMISFAW